MFTLLQEVDVKYSVHCTLSQDGVQTNCTSCRTHQPTLVGCSRVSVISNIIESMGQMQSVSSN